MQMIVRDGRQCGHSRNRPLMGVAAMFFLMASILVGASPAQAQNIYIAPLWRIVLPSSLSNDLTPTELNKSRPNLYPIQIITMDQGFSVIDKEKTIPVLREGSQLVRVSSNIHAVYCTWDFGPVKANRIFMTPGQILCVFDSNADGRFDKYFFKFSMMAASLTFNFGKPPKIRDIGSELPYRYADPLLYEFPLPVRFGIGVYGKSGKCFGVLNIKVGKETSMRHDNILSCGQGQTVEVFGVTATVFSESGDVTRIIFDKSVETRPFPMGPCNPC